MSNETIAKISKTTNGLTVTLFTLISALIIGLVGVACQVSTRSPIDPTRMVNARDLNIEYQVWVAEQNVYQRKFELAADDLEIQTKQLTAVGEAIQELAAGGVPSIPGLMQLLLGAGFAGLLVDNVRKTKTAINASKSNPNG